jgi:hypothetical protein
MNQLLYLTLFGFDDGALQADPEPYGKSKTDSSERSGISSGLGAVGSAGVDKHTGRYQAGPLTICGKEGSGL